MKNLINRIGVRLVNNKKRLFRVDIKGNLHVTQNIDNDLRAIRESKVTLMLNNPVNY